MDIYSLEEFQLILKNNKLFRPLSDEDLNNIYFGAQIVCFKKTKHVFEEGARQNGIFYILSGLIKLYKIGTKGRVQILQFVKAGDVIGYDSLLSLQPTSNAAMVIEDVELVSIPQKTMTNILMENNEFRFGIMQLACIELKMAQDSMFDLGQKSLKSRTVDFLLFLREKFGLDKCNMIDVSLDREDLAQSLGCTMQSVIRILSELRREKAIVTHGKKIGIL